MYFHVRMAISCPLAPTLPFFVEVRDDFCTSPMRGLWIVLAPRNRSVRYYVPCTWSHVVVGIGVDTLLFTREAIETGTTSFGSGDIHLRRASLGYLRPELLRLLQPNGCLSEQTPTSLYPVHARLTSSGRPPSQLYA